MHMQKCVKNPALHGCAHRKGLRRSRGCYYSHFSLLCLPPVEPMTQSFPVLFKVPLWSRCRNRSVGLMLSDREVSCIVPGVKERQHVFTPHRCSALLLQSVFIPPRQIRSHANVQPCSCGVRKEVGGGLHRKTRQGCGLSLPRNLCCAAVLFHSHIYTSSLTSAIVNDDALSSGRPAASASRK